MSSIGVLPLSIVCELWLCLVCGIKHSTGHICSLYLKCRAILRELGGRFEFEVNEAIQGDPFGANIGKFGAKYTYIQN